MFKRIKNWFDKKLTLILAPSRGSRSWHISMSYPFATFLSVVFFSVFVAGAYISDLYISYFEAVNTNRKLVLEKNLYSKKVEETLDMLQKVKNIEMQLRGMLGMKSERKIIENFPAGGALSDDKINFTDEIDNIYEISRFTSNVNEVKRETWEQEQSAKNINNFIMRKRDILLSTPSIWPIFGYVTSGYGWRTHPMIQKREFHRAIDIYSPLGRSTPIRSTARGRVVVAGWAGSLGKIVILDHGNGFSTRYCHCSNLIVEQGEKVEQGQILGYVGSTGLSTGNHLHYEVWYRGKPINPVQFVRGR
ncbi:MAG: M23 family metallopeptidase [Elusimicrobia bacterium]|nr:M23 family metallopeptidase [Elusimicrobiota bacterium]